MGIIKKKYSFLLKLWKKKWNLTSHENVSVFICNNNGHTHSDDNIFGSSGLQIVEFHILLRQRNTLTATAVVAPVHEKMRAQSMNFRSLPRWTTSHFWQVNCYYSLRLRCQFILAFQFTARRMCDTWIFGERIGLPSHSINFTMD